MSDDQPEYSAVQDPYRIYGEAMTAWTRLESAIFRWFQYSTRMSDPLARAVFYSARNFTGRRDMLLAAMPYAVLTDPEQAFIRAALKKTRRYSEFRNQMAHREPILDTREQSRSYLQMIMIEGADVAADPDAITLKQLRIATQNVLELRTLLDAAFPPDRLPTASVETYLLQVRTLPNEAHSEEPAPIQEQNKPPPQRRPK
jgi:hypothetical protein